MTYIYGLPMKRDCYRSANTAAHFGRNCHVLAWEITHFSDSNQTLTQDMPLCMNFLSRLLRPSNVRPCTLSW